MNEDRDIEAIWQREPLDYFNTVGDMLNGKISKSRQIINELEEYYIIEELSLHLSEYFNDSKFRSDNIVIITRQEIEKFLYKNRFLNLFSKPMEERASFNVTDEKNNKRHELMVNGKKVTVTLGDTVYAQGENNTIYSKFDLVLPSNSKFDKSGNSSKIITDRFEFDFTINFDESEYDLPEGYLDNYISNDNNDEKHSNNYFRYTPFVVNVSIKINFKILKFILKGKWEYFSWIDSFLDKLETDMSEEYYFKKINWDSTYTILQSLNKQSKINM